MHLLSPRVLAAGLSSGVTTVLAQEFGPVWGVGVSSPWALRHAFAALDAYPVNLGFLARGSSSRPNVLELAGVGNVIGSSTNPTLPYGRDADPGHDNERVLRYLAKLPINPALAHGLAHEVGTIAPGRLADLVLWRPALFGAKPQLVLKAGFPAWGVTGDPNAATDACQPR